MNDITDPRIDSIKTLLSHITNTFIDSTKNSETTNIKSINQIIKNTNILQYKLLAFKQAKKVSKLMIENNTLRQNLLHDAIKSDAFNYCMHNEMDIKKEIDFVYAGDHHQKTHKSNYNLYNANLKNDYNKNNIYSNKLNFTTLDSNKLNKNKELNFQYTPSSINSSNGNFIITSKKTGNPSFNKNKNNFKKENHFDSYGSEFNLCDEIQKMNENDQTYSTLTPVDLNRIFSTNPTAHSTVDSKLPNRQMKINSKTNKNANGSFVHDYDKDLHLKQQIVNLSNQNDSEFKKKAAEKHSNGKKRKSQSEDNLQITKEERDAYTKFMKNHPAFTHNKNLTKKIIEKIKILMVNAKKKETIEKELERDKNRNIQSQSSYSLGSTSSASTTTSIANDKDIKSAFSRDSTDDNNSLNISDLVATNDDVFDESVDDSCEEYKSQYSKRNKNESLDITIFYDAKHIEVARSDDNRDMILKEIESLKNQITEIQTEKNKILNLHEHDLKSTQEFHALEVNTLLAKLKSDTTMSESLIHSELENLKLRQESSKKNLVTSNQLTISNIIKRQDNLENQLIKLEEDLQNLNKLENNLGLDLNSINATSNTSKINLMETSKCSDNTSSAQIQDENESHKSTITTKENTCKNTVLDQVSIIAATSGTTSSSLKSITSTTTGTTEDFNSGSLDKLANSKLATDNEKNTTVETINKINKNNTNWNPNVDLTNVFKSLSQKAQPSASPAETTNSNTNKKNNSDQIAEKNRQENVPSINQHQSNKIFQNNQPLTLGTTNKQIVNDINTRNQWLSSMKSRNLQIDQKIEKQLLEIKKPAEEQNKLILPPNDCEEWYDLRYIRPVYDFYIIGTGLKNFCEDINRRHNEISRCTGIPIANIITSSPRIDHHTKMLYYKVAVKTLNDFIKALCAWAPDAFENGIKSTRAPIEFLRVTILDIEKKHNLIGTDATTTISNAEKYWSIKNLQRAQYIDSQSGAQIILNKATCNFIKLSLLSKAIKNRIQLDMTCTSHCVTLGPFKLLLICIKCGTGNHSERSCKESSCYRCQGTDHLVSNCTNKLKCINCGGPHLCTSDLCVDLVKKTVSEYQFIVDFELSEGIIVHPIQLFKTRLTFEEYDNHCTEKSDEVQEDKEKLKKEIWLEYQPLFEMQNKQIAALNKTAAEHSEKLKSHETKFEKVFETIASNSAKLDNIVKEQASSHSLLLAINEKLSKNN